MNRLAAINAQMSVASWVECAAVADRDSALDPGDVDDLISVAGVDLVPVSVEHGRLAHAAHHRFGRGSGSPARLNFGDCFAYALAMEAGEPLLFKGDDFAHTDVVSALH